MRVSQKYRGNTPAAAEREAIIRIVGIGSMICFLLLAAGITRAEPRVELELVTEAGFPAAKSHQWLAALQGLQLGNMRIRAARSSDRVEVQQRGSGSSAVYQVTGLLTSRDTLRVPGGEFRLGDTAGLKRWIGKLKEGGETRLHETEAAFGLTPTQLVGVHESLKTLVPFETKGQRPFAVMKRISGSLTLRFLADAAARRSMEREGVVLDELQGLSAGTVLAAILRPLGLVLVPQKQPDGQIKLWITDVRQARESWPVGWPSDRSPRETLPELFNFLNVEIQDTPLDDALQAISGRIKAPILYDHNSLARQQVDPKTIKVSSDPGRNYYKGIIDRLANRAGMTSELRVDDAGKPFLWMSTLQRR